MAASKNDSSEKKKDPTRRRLDEARKDGDISKSKELTSSVQLATWLATAAFGGPVLFGRLRSVLDLAVSTTATPSQGAMAAIGVQCAETGVAAVLLLIAPSVAAGLAANFAQVGGLFALERLKFNLGNLNPVDGIAKIFKTDNLVELAKSVAKLAIVLVIAVLVVRDEAPALLSATGDGPHALLAAFGRALMRLLAPVAAASLAIGVLDAIYQRHAYLQRMRMTISEHREDRKRTEGDPHQKSRRRRLYREWSRQNAAEASRGASVVVTNPTHFAVALAYDPAEHDAPVVAAKGQDHVAQAIREAAVDAEVPILRNPTLARALHERVEVGEPVPGDLFVAVAEAIVWAGRIRDQTAAGGSDV